MTIRGLYLIGGNGGGISVLTYYFSIVFSIVIFPSNWEQLNAEIFSL